MPHLFIYKLLSVTQTSLKNVWQSDLLSPDRRFSSLVRYSWYILATMKCNGCVIIGKNNDTLPMIIYTLKGQTYKSAS